MKNETEESDNAILRGLFEQSMAGTLPARDLHMSAELNKAILGEETLDQSNNESTKLRQFVEEEQNSLKIVVHDPLISKTASFLTSISTMRATALCGPSFSGKSTIINLALNYSQKVKEQNIECHRIHPKTCSLQQLFGWFSDDGYSKWYDGILTKHMRLISKYQI